MQAKFYSTNFVSMKFGVLKVVTCEKPGRGPPSEWEAVRNKTGLQNLLFLLSNQVLLNLVSMVHRLEN